MMTDWIYTEPADPREWTARLAAHLLASLTGTGTPAGNRLPYTEGQLADVARLILDLDTDVPGPVPPQRRITAALLGLQGWPAETAQLGASLMDRFDLQGLLVGEPQAVSILGLSRTRMRERRQAGDIRPRFIQPGGHAALGAVVYSLGDVLATLAYRRDHTERGPGQRRWPPWERWR